MPRDANHQSSQRTAKMRHLLTAVAVAVALGASVTLADISQHQAGPTRKAGVHSASAATAELTSLSVPVSFTVGVSPAAVLSPSTRSRAISLVIGRLNQQLAARHLQGRKVGLVQVFASGSISRIQRSQSAAHFVLDSLRRHDLIFAKAVGQGFWTGSGNYFLFQIYFLG
jgi:hypothetical protein